jgi:flagellin-specific chaperone FliS
MWLFTDKGFISAVTHRDDASKMMVRARDKQSLEGLAKAGKTEVETTLNADYPHRIVVTKATLKKWLNNQIDEATYDNFKTQVAKTRGYDFVKPLHDVWETMHQVEDVKRRRWFGYEAWDDDLYEEYTENSNFRLFDDFD